MNEAPERSSHSLTQTQMGLYALKLANHTTNWQRARGLVVKALTLPASHLTGRFGLSAPNVRDFGSIPGVSIITNFLFVHFLTKIILKHATSEVDYSPLNQVLSSHAIYYG
jgi:hypothetical protein